MLKQNWRFISRVERLGDVLIIIASFFAAYYGRSSLLFWNDIFDLGLPLRGDTLAPLKDYFIVLVIALIAYIVALNVMNAYSSMRLSSIGRLLRVSILSSVFVFFVLSSILFVLKLDLSRSFISLFCFLGSVFLTAERFVVLKFLRFWRRRGRNFRNILICGIGEQSIRLAREVALRPELGIGIKGFADLREASLLDDSLMAQFHHDLLSHARVTMGNLVTGKRGISKMLEEGAIDEVIFTNVVEVMPLVEEMVLICSEQGVRTTIAADLFSMGMVKSGMSYFGGMPLIHFQTPPGDRWELGVKRFVDISVSTLLLILLAPLMIFIALGVRLTSPGPVLFKQKRVGLNGRLFSLYKFRSMYADAEERRKVLERWNEMRGPVFKMARDPRVTTFGRFLRRFSLDELPQLYNVLRGDMSLVGPRPPIPGEVSMYERKDRRRLSMRPGLTCTWQVSGRNNISDFDSWVKLDLEYIDNWSLGRDVVLLVRTIPAVLFGTGAR